ncbi:hypothetical protein [Paraburkholderia sp.]|uniref:hypothetical protein n=1 Tax=Paraburkholderia sp. TaxID=1926495 RepID=UPI003C7B9E0D
MLQLSLQPTALTLALLYVFLRYRFDESTADALSAKREEFEVALRRAIVEQVNTAVNAHLGGTPLPDGLHIDVDELRAFTARLKGMYVILTEWCDTDLKPDRFGRRYANLGHPNATYSRWAGRMVFTAWGTRDVENKEPFRVRIEPRYIVMLEPPSRTRVLVRTQIRFIVSKGSIDLAVPFVMATLAMFVCLYKIGFYLAK